LAAAVVIVIVVVVVGAALTAGIFVYLKFFKKKNKGTDGYEVAASGDGEKHRYIAISAPYPEGIRNPNVNWSDDGNGYEDGSGKAGSVKGADL
jgi:hypothetical protein